jgi:hypothetical protein
MKNVYNSGELVKSYRLNLPRVFGISIPIPNVITPGRNRRKELITRNFGNSLSTEPIAHPGT